VRYSVERMWTHKKYQKENRMPEKQHVLNWFEIPVKDLNRAKTFYEEVLGIKMQVNEMGESSLAFFTEEQSVVGGALIKARGMEPCDKGSLVYLNGGDNLEHFLQKVEAAGGKIVLPKTQIGDHGFIAYFIDTEGNRVAFHSRS
jgi:predicted enzyme related to lactoylglutathione lyase